MKILFISVIFILIILNILVQENIIEVTKESIVTKCSGLNVTDTAYCLRGNIKTFYKFNSTKDSINLSFNELKEKGGDCRNYAFLYEELGSSLGFNATTIRTEGIKGVMPAHRIAVIYDSITYCKLDQTKVDCRSILD